MLPQHASSSPDGRQLVVVGDDPEGRLVDSESGSVACVIYLTILVLFVLHCKVIIKDTSYLS